MIERLTAALKERYELIEELGEGGMATVYLADDVKHGRKVAVKVLRPELAAVIGGERFVAEIRTTAALQHPHILPLFDSGEAESFLYYVMPYVEGESLRGRLDRERQLEVDEAVRIARAVASALHYAHERDILHRDIKPENILLHAGEPVVADFGIALAISAAGGGRMTETGLSLGTPHYMSPEQAAADRDLTPRSDVYSVGCVLYEMLAGQPPHTGPTAQSVLVRILTEEPRPVSDARATVPSHVRDAVAKSLEKLPADRFGSAEEFREALGDPGFTYVRAVPAGRRTMVTTPATADTSRGAVSAGRPLAGGLHAAVTLALAGTAAWLALGDRGDAAAGPDVPVVSFVLADSATSVNRVEVAPDGTIVFLKDGRIQVRPAGALEAAPIPGVDQVGDFALSPDGRWAVFNTRSDAGLKKVQLSGGSVADVWRKPGQISIFPSWGEDGWIYFTAGGGRPEEIRRVRDVGGEAERVFGAERRFPLHPRVLPGSRALLLTLTNTSAAEGRVLLLEPETGDTTELVSSGFDARWSPTGHVIYAHPSGALWAFPFDLDRLEATGPPAPVLEGARTVASFGTFGLGPGGTLAYVTGSGTGESGAGFTFLLLDPEGDRQPLPVEPSDHYDARLSPDGRSMAYTRSSDIWIFDLDRGSNVPLTEGGTGQHNPVWSPDGTRIVYRSDDDLMVRPVDRSGPARPVRSTEEPDNPVAWLPDGTVIISTQGAQDGNLWAVDIDDDTPPRPLLNANWLERAASISPDGAWMAYVSARSGSPQVYVRSWPGLEGETLVSREEGDIQGASYPQWSGDGRTLYYQKIDRIFAARVETRSGFEVVSTTTLPVRLVGPVQHIHPDGRLLGAVPPGMNQRDPDDQVPERLVVITNWFSEMERRLGAGGG